MKYLLFCLPLAVFAVASMYNSIKFEQEISGRLKRASDSSTIEIAKSELSAAIHSMEQRRLTSGYTNLLFHTPDCDVGFWYSNIVEAEKEIQEFPTNSSPVDKSNQLVKLREVLLDHGEGGDYVTMPANISFHPYVHGVYFIFFLCLILVGVGVICWLVE